MSGLALIGGHWEAGGGAPLSSADPITDEPVWQGAAVDADQVQRALVGLAQAQPAWAARPQVERAAVLERVAVLAAERQDELAGWIAAEVGKPLWEARQEAAAVAGKVAATLQAWQDEEQPTREQNGLTLQCRRRPLGVMAVLGPFNFPMHLPNGQILPALLAGNAVAFKPSERTPGCGAALVHLLLDAGVPAGVLAFLPGARPVGEAVVDDPHLAGLFFTGSAAGGSAIHRRLAGRPEVLLALEMGGNNPLVVWEPDDRAAAVRSIILSAFLTAGQRCTCARRLILPQGEAGDALVTDLVAAMASIRIGHYRDDPEPFAGPVIDDRAREMLFEREADLPADRLIRPLATLGHPRLLQPGLADVTGLDQPDEELFGPWLLIERVPDFAAAIAAADRTRFGLAAALLDRDPDRWQAFQAGVAAGVVNWNRQTTGASGSLPFGGLGASGNHHPAGAHAGRWCVDAVAQLRAAHCPPPGTQPGLGPS